MLEMNTSGHVFCVRRGRGELFPRVLAYRFQHVVAASPSRVLVSEQQRLLDQRVDEVDDIEAVRIVFEKHCGTGVEVESAYEDRRTSKGDLFYRTQQVERP